MSDPILKELWSIKDQIAREHGYDLDALVAHFQEAGRAKDREVVDLSTRNKIKKQSPLDDEQK